MRKRRRRRRRNQSDDDTARRERLRHRRSGGRAAALIGPEGVFLVDAQFPAVTEKIVAALKQLTPAPIRLLVNTHVHGDHTGGNENFAKVGATILGRPEPARAARHPRPAPNGQTPAPSPAAALPVVLFDDQITVSLNGETVQIIPLAPSHTNGDTAVKFVNADVLMTGDVFRSEGYPAADRRTAAACSAY